MSKGEYVGRVFTQTWRAERDPGGDLRGALTPVKAKHHACITDPKVIGELLRSINGLVGSYTTKCALQLAPLVFDRDSPHLAGIICIFVYFLFNFIF